MSDYAPCPIARPRRVSFLVFLAGLAAMTTGASRPAAAAGVPTWEPLGFAGHEFTSLYTVPDNPCVVAWTALGNGGLGVSTDCGNQYARLFLLSAHDVTAQNENIGYVAAGTLGIAKTALEFKLPMVVAPTPPPAVQTEETITGGEHESKVD